VIGPAAHAGGGVLVGLLGCPRGRRGVLLDRRRQARCRRPAAWLRST
jgi:hypothetical protein